MTKKKLWTKKQQKEHRKLWIEALRSGQYKQGQSCLRNYDNYCCLGVACEVASINGITLEIAMKGSRYTYNNNTEYPPEIVMKYFGLTNNEGIYHGGMSLVKNNDEDKLSFKEIASIIESEPKGLFE